MTLDDPGHHGYYRMDSAEVVSDGYSWRVTSMLKLEGKVGFQRGLSTLLCVLLSLNCLFTNT